MKKIFFVALSLFLTGVFLSEDVHAQKRKKKVAVPEKSIYDLDTLIKPIPFQRSHWHDNIDKAQRGADVSDGHIDGLIYYAEDTVLTNLLTESMLDEVDQLQITIENLPFTGDVYTSQEGQLKIGYLVALADLVRDFNQDNRNGPVFWARVVANFKEMVIAKHEGRLLEFVKANNNVYSFANASLLKGNLEAKTMVYKQMAKEEPAFMIHKLGEFSREPYADEVIAEAAKVVPNEVFNYASSTNYALSGAVKRSKDPLVQTIVKITEQSKSPLKAMSFLSDVHNGKLTVDEVDKITSNQDLFFKNLVRLKLENASLGDKTFTSELQYRGLKYVREMNDLHESPDAVRFKCIDGFKPEELYFIMVYGQDEIYTSSYVGTFRRMMQRMDSMKGDELLAKVNYDKFRTFLRMAAGYNTLSDFLKTIEAEKKTVLMRDFIAGLGKGREDDLEDAVDVADAFGSINDSDLVVFLQDEVKKNYEEAYKNRSMKGMRVYALLATLFDGLKASENEEAMKQQSEVLQLPPINMVRYNDLAKDSGVVYEQYFFYGDEDGRASYASFLGNFRDGKWKVTPSKSWTTIASTSGRKIVIYANLPLTEPEDEEAQKQLAAYLAAENITPTIVVHRGHSYHLPLTLERLNKNVRIVMLGSCGGYHNLATVLDLSPDAHIISSKQTGAMAVNDPIIKSINDRILEGKDVDWITMWKSLDGYFAGKGALRETFNDYVPPQKNLGAIFIKAYRKLANSQAEI